MRTTVTWRSRPSGRSEVRRLSVSCATSSRDGSRSGGRPWTTSAFPRTVSRSIRSRRRKAVRSARMPHSRSPGSETREASPPSGSSRRAPARRTGTRLRGRRTCFRSETLSRTDDVIRRLFVGPDASRAALAGLVFGEENAGAFGLHSRGGGERTSYARRWMIPCGPVDGQRSTLRRTHIIVCAFSAFSTGSAPPAPVSSHPSSP